MGRGNADDIGHFLGAVRPDHDIGRLVFDPGERMAVLEADGLARLHTVAKALLEHRNCGQNVLGLCGLGHSFHCRFLIC